MPLYMPSFVALTHSSPHTPLLIFPWRPKTILHISPRSADRSRRFLQDLHQKALSNGARQTPLAFLLFPSLHLPLKPNPSCSTTINALIRSLQLLISFSPRLESSHRGGMDGEISNIKKWIILYPIYINSKKTIAEGRRISTSKACENPTCAEIGDCCSHLKLPFAIEIDKAYPRDFMQRGRVRVLLKKEDGTFSNPAISSRKQLMLRIAELVPRHPGRTKKQEPAAASTSGAGPSKSGKGGKKKR